MTDLEGVLDAVGPRLRGLRQSRDLTLAQVSATTGTSVSTLSRLESGRRRPTLELLLPLAAAYAVPLDELVGAPETGDPRVRPKPFVRAGMTFVPLSQRPGGVRAYKQIVPPAWPPPDREPQVHEGFEWMYVLSGRLSLRLGDRELLLGPGEVAEFDTRLPHRVSNPGTAVLELLSLFGPQGERMHVRAQPSRRAGQDLGQG